MADDNTLWVGGLAEQVTEDHLFELFLQAGPLEKVTRAKEKDGTLKKFAFVEFTHMESVPYAIQVMDGIKLFNHHLRLKGRTGSQHDNSHSSSPTSHSHHSGSPSSRSHSHRGGPDYHRSRSYGMDERKRGPPPPSLFMSQSSHPGHSHHKRGMTRSSSGGEDSRGQSNRPFNGPADPLSQPFSSGATYTASNMQPQSFDDRRNRLLQKQSMSSSFQAQAQQPSMGNNQYGGYNFNYAQSFSSGYGQQPMQQQQQQWYQNQW